MSKNEIPRGQVLMNDMSSCCHDMIGSLIDYLEHKQKSEMGERERGKGRIHEKGVTAEGIGIGVKGSTSQTGEKTSTGQVGQKLEERGKPEQIFSEKGQ